MHDTQLCLFKWRALFINRIRTCLFGYPRNDLIMTDLCAHTIKILNSLG